MLKKTTLIVGLCFLLLVMGPIGETTANATSPMMSPVSDPGGPYAGCVGQMITLDGTGSYDPDPGGMIVSYDWDFGDGHTASGPTPMHAYLYAGEYTVVLCVTDDEGNTACDNTTVIITGASAVESRSWGEIKALLGG